MKNYKGNSKFAGSMFLLAMAASLTGGILVQGVIDKPDFMNDILRLKGVILAGVILELINAFAVIGIAAAFWTPFKQRYPSIAIGYLSVRIIESAVCAAAAFIPITLLTLARQNSNAAMTADMMRTIRGDLVAYAVPIFFGVGAILLYTMLCRSRLIPKYIAVWGLIATIAVMANMCVPVVELKAVLALPIIANEIYLGLYLLIKGFRKEITTNVWRN